MADGLNRAPLPLDDAVALIRESVRPISEVETVALNDALGRVLAAPLAAPRALPPFDNTAVDGYAFRRADVVEGGAARLALSGESAAGIPFSGALPQGTAIRISTGAVLPQGADTVAMQEDCRREGNAVIVDPVPETGANVRYAGNDISVGAVALPPGHRLRPQDIALARALGFTEVLVRRRLRIAIAATGAELREGGAELGPGQIIETNALMLRQLTAGLPVTVTQIDPLPDDRAATERALAEAGAAHDVTITTGGVSVGDHDHVRPALETVGRVLFWRIAIRPGKPVLFGTLGSGWFAGLPGNPVSALVTFLLVVRPLLDGLTGTEPRNFPGFRVPLATAVRKDTQFREFQRARLVSSMDGWRAEPYRDQSSNLLTSMTGADGLLDLAPGTGVIDEGTPVLFRPFEMLVG